MQKPDIYEAVLAHFDGSPGKLRAALKGENLSTGSMWRNRGIPPEYAKRIERLCGVSVKVIRPDDWELYWPEGKPKRRAAKATA